MFHKVNPTQFKLTTQAGRVGLLCGITAGTVTREEAEDAVMADIEKRPYRKPVVVPDRNGVEVRFDSVREAAHFLLKSSKKSISKSRYALCLNNMEKFIARRCNQDRWMGFYWAE